MQSVSSESKNGKKSGLICPGVPYMQSLQLLYMFACTGPIQVLNGPLLRLHALKN